MIDKEIIKSIREKIIKNMTDKELKKYLRFSFFYFRKDVKTIKALIKAEIRQRKEV